VLLHDAAFRRALECHLWGFSCEREGDGFVTCSEKLNRGIRFQTNLGSLYGTPLLMESHFQTQPFHDICRESQIQDEIPAIIRRCLARIRSWPVPRNWSFQDWFDEAEEIATVAAWQAVSDYNQPAATAFPCFAHQRILSSVRTRYRQEFLYGLRFASSFLEHSTDSDEHASDRPQHHIEEPVEPLRYGDLTEALSKLSREHHEVIEHLYWRGRTETEVAKSIGLSQRAVSKRKQGALKALRIFLRTK